MSSAFTDHEITAYFDEHLPVERATALEQQLRDSPALRQRASQLVRRRDQGGHTVGEIWRRRRVSCLSRSQLGGYVLGTLPPAVAKYVEFHLNTIGCRLCAANLSDMQAAQKEEPSANSRRRKFFESSAGLLRNP